MFGWRNVDRLVEKIHPGPANFDRGVKLAPTTKALISLLTKKDQSSCSISQTSNTPIYRMVTSLERIQAAVIDGRARTPRYIQKQLFNLHTALVSASATIHAAIVQDSGNSSAETWLEIHQTLQAVRDQYSAIELSEVLNAEYSIANGKDRLARRRPYGCVYLLVNRHTRFNSIVQPLAVAIAAGNCVVVEVR